MPHNMNDKVIRACYLPALLAAVSFAACSSSHGQETDKSEKIVRPVEVVKVQRDSLTDWLTLSGEIHGELEVDVFAEIPERIVAIFVETGDAVKAGQVLIALRKGTLPDAVTSSAAGLQAAHVRLTASEADLTRTEKLYKGGLATDSQLTNLRAAVESARVQLIQLEAAVRQSQNMADKTLVVAPNDGYVGQLNVDVGDMAAPQMPVLSIVRFERIKVKAQASDLDFPILALGLPTIVTSKASPGVVMHGGLSRISPVVDRISRSIRVEALFDNEGYKLRPGMLADLRVRIAEHKDALVLPNSALIDRRANGSAAVFVIQNGKAQRRTIKAGFRQADRVQIVSGLAAGEQVVTLGQNLLREGDPVEVVRLDGTSLGAR
jgi:RND family efflux transporter MFP subunit